MRYVDMDMDMGIHVETNAHMYAHVHVHVHGQYLNSLNTSGADIVPERS